MHACHDLTCFLHDGEAAIQDLRERYHDDPDVEVVEVSCLGRCDTAPAVAVNERSAPLVEVHELVQAARQAVGAHLAPTVAERRPAPWPNDPYPAATGMAERYASLRALLAGEVDPDDVVAILKESGLRGMGGAGFPTGQKWDLVRSDRARWGEVRRVQRR